MGRLGGRFSELAGVSINGGGIYFEPGNYKVRLGKIKYKDDTQSGDDAFIVETQILESDNPVRGPGTKASQVVSIKKKYLETCLADIKQFAGAVMELEDTDKYNEPICADDQMMATQKGCTAQAAANNRFWEQTIEALCSDAQPADGIMIRLNCTKKEGKKFTKHIWGPVVHEEPADPNTTF